MIPYVRSEGLHSKYIVQQKEQKAAVPGYGLKLTYFMFNSIMVYQFLMLHKSFMGRSTKIF
jgi:hypothetical protein